MFKKAYYVNKIEFPSNRHKVVQYNFVPIAGKFSFYSTTILITRVGVLRMKRINPNTNDEDVDVDICCNISQCVNLVEQIPSFFLTDWSMSICCGKKSLLLSGIHNFLSSIYAYINYLILHCQIFRLENLLCGLLCAIV